MLEIGRNCWRIERAERAAVVIDAADYFRLARKAMLQARSQILLIGWDFDTRICLDYRSDDGAPVELGAFLSWLPKNRPGLQIHILKWDVGAVKLLGRGTTVLRLMKWAANKQIHFKLDGAHPTGASHHQKIVVIDDALAFCGGIDMTADRWDTREHRDGDEHRKRPTTRRRYGPWHDATMAVDAAAAAALGDLSRERWRAAGGEPIDPPRANGDPWPNELEPTFRNADIAIARTRGQYRAVQPVREIEALFVDSISAARRFVYAENQYFASRAVAEAVAKRLSESNGPEFVFVNPKSGQGWLEEEVMDSARARLLELIRAADRFGRFRMYSPVTEAGKDIYVHSKIMIIDDERLRVGSANLNNRSMGLDSECDVMIDATRDGNAEAAAAIAAIRRDLMAEHLSVSVDAVEARFAETQSLARTIDSFERGEGRTLVPIIPEEPNAIEKAVADSQALDPESSGEPFEPIARPGLLQRL